MKRMMPFVGVLAMVVAVAACGNGHKEGRTVAVSVAPQKELLESIAGPEIKVITVLPPNSDAETFEPDMRVLEQLHGADVWFTLETPGFEQSLLQRLSATEGPKTVNVAKGIVRVNDTHGHDTDPHVWVSAKNARILSKSMASVLKSEFPDETGAIEANWQRADSVLQAYDNELASILEGAKVKSFAIWHPSLSYFARDYGLTQIAVEQEGKEVTPRQLRQRLDEIKRSGVGVMFYDVSHDSRSVEELARQSGLLAVGLDLNGVNWQRSLLSAAKAIASQGRETVNIGGADLTKE